MFFAGIARAENSKLTYNLYNSVLYIGLLKRMELKCFERKSRTTTIYVQFHKKENENLFSPKCFVVATRFPVGTIFVNE